MDMWLKMGITIFGGLGVFLYGMQRMSRGLESAGGEQMRKWLQTLTSNPIGGIATGLLVTCIIQSSSATTVMVVSLAHAGFLKLTQAIGVIMGANIGTTFTGWLVAVLGFKFKISYFAMIAVGVGVILIFIGPGRRRGLWGEILVGFGLLFMGLGIMKNGVKPLRKLPEVGEWMRSFSAGEGIGTLLLIVLIGTIITVLIQSSSATMALTMTLAAQGAIDFPTAAALVLGENIGTTITANLAALGTDIAARRAARVHFLFNSLGVLWALVLFSPLLSLIDWFVPGAMTEAAQVPSHMAAFHTFFNIVNVLVFIPFIGLLAKTAEKMVPGEPGEGENRHIKYLDARVSATPELAMIAVRQELERMSRSALDMFKSVMELYNKPDVKAKEQVKKIQELENLLDILEREITVYLAEVGRHEVSETTSQEISACLHMSHNLEKIGDYCEGLLRLLRKKYSEKLAFSEKANSDIHEIAKHVESFLKLIDDNILEEKPDIMEVAEKTENTIDKMRWDFRKEHVKRLVDSECKVESGLLFIDLITHFEKIGDHAYNIAEYLCGVRSK